MGRVDDEGAVVDAELRVRGRLALPPLDL